MVSQITKQIAFKLVPPPRINQYLPKAIPTKPFATSPKPPHSKNQKDTTTKTQVYLLSLSAVTAASLWQLLNAPNLKDPAPYHLLREFM